MRRSNNAASSKGTTHSTCNKSEYVTSVTKVRVLNERYGTVKRRKTRSSAYRRHVS